MVFSPKKKENLVLTHTHSVAAKLLKRKPPKIYRLSQFPFSSSSMASILTTPSRLFLLKPPSPSTPLRRQFTTFAPPFPSIHHSRQPRRFSTAVIAAAAKKGKSSSELAAKKEKQVDKVEEEEVEVEEDLPWIQEKALDVVEFTGTVTQAIPGPRVGSSKLPWLLAVPLTYLGVTFVIAFVKTVRKFNSPRKKRRNLVNKNAFLCKSIDELIQKNQVETSALEGLLEKTGFDMEDLIRKYIRYALREKPFNPELVADLIRLRKASLLDDSNVAEILNEISRRVVSEFGPVVMDVSGYSQKGLERKIAVQTMFGKVFYLSELPEFCSRDGSLIIKEIFGVTDDDADELRATTLSQSGDMESLEKMAADSKEKDAEGSSSTAP